MEPLQRLEAAAKQLQDETAKLEALAPFDEGRMVATFGALGPEQRAQFCNDLARAMEQQAMAIDTWRFWRLRAAEFIERYAATLKKEPAKQNMKSR